MCRETKDSHGPCLLADAFVAPFSLFYPQMFSPSSLAATKDLHPKKAPVKCPIPKRMYLWYVVFTYIHRGGNCGTQSAPTIFGRDPMPANSITPLIAISTFCQ